MGAKGGRTGAAAGPGDSGVTERQGVSAIAVNLYKLIAWFPKKENIK